MTTPSHTTTDPHRRSLGNKLSAWTHTLLWWPVWAWAVILGGALLRFSFVFQDIAFIDQLFVPDDTYYTLSIARSLSSGQGPIASADILTSGFQPLLAFLLVPVFWFSQNPDHSLRSALAYSAFFGTVSIGLLFLVAKHCWSPTIGVALGLLWALSPIALRADLNGLETSLASCCNLALLFAWLQARRHPTPRRWTCVGLFCGLALLARIDSAFFVALIGLIEMFQRNRAILRTIFVALLVVLPWWGYCAWTFGSIVPESGLAVREIALDHFADGSNLRTITTQSIACLLSGPFGSGLTLRVWLSSLSGAWIAASFALLFVIFLFACFALYKNQQIEISVWVFFSISLLFFYTYYIHAFWFFGRYFIPIQISMLFIIGTLFHFLHTHLSRRKILFLSILYGLAVVFFVGLESFSLYTSHAYFNVEYDIHGAKGYRQQALHALRHIPEKSRIGALQSGALHYFAQGRWTIINLDGVVNRHAAKAFSTKKLSEYIQKENISFVADWLFNVLAIKRRSSSKTNLSFYEVWSDFPPQGVTQFRIYHVARQP